MSFDWAQYLELANHLVGKAGAPTEEAKQRAAISRAYYAAFCSGRAFAESVDSLDPPLYQEPVHRRVIEHFKGAPDKIRRGIGASLDGLKRERVRADYDSRPFAGNVKYTVDSCLMRSTSVLRDIDALRKKAGSP